MGQNLKSPAAFSTVQAPNWRRQSSVWEKVAASLPSLTLQGDMGAWILEQDMSVRTMIGKSLVGVCDQLYVWLTNVPWVS